MMLTHRHELVECFENADRAGYVSGPDRAFVADVDEVSSHLCTHERVTYWIHPI